MENIAKWIMIAIMTMFAVAAALSGATWYLLEIGSPFAIVTGVPAATLGCSAIINAIRLALIR